MACPAVALLALLAAVCVLGADARFAPSESSTGRSLLQTVDCSRIPNCSACRNQRVGGSTLLQCTACEASYKPNGDYSSCDCAPGYKRVGLSCVSCSTGSWCAGGADADGNDIAAVSCGDGMTTLIPTAVREDQCVTLAGWGLTSAGAALCDVASYSTGKARNPCRACGGGLTTDTTGSTSFSDCVSPPGSYFDKNAAKPCPKGTFATANNRNAACTTCSAGVTTAAASSTAPGDCALAKPGYKKTAATTAAKCAVNSYQPLTANVATCTDCPTNMVTLKTGAATRTACVAKPGYAYQDDTTGATACDTGSYKTGYNRRPCVACGDGFTTTGSAKISFADCYIPQGWGTTKVGAAYVAAECAVGTYGASKNTFGIKSLPCTPCPTGMTAPAGSNGPDDCVLVPGWGYDQVTGTAAKCEAGSYSIGGGRDECVACGEGYTTPTDASDNVSDCQIAPGYGYKTGGDPEPCAKGFFGTGGVSKTCTACSGQTMTTLDSLATSQADCDVCIAGFGGAGCGACAANSYQQGDSASCTACAAGLQAPVGALSADACLAPWTSLPPSVDSIAVDTADASYVTLTADASALDCKAACAAATTTCMFYTFDSTNTKCYLASTTSGSDKIAFKSATGTFTIWSWTASASVGTDFGTATTGTTQAACLARCDASDECIAAVFSSGTCSLKQASTSPDFKACEYRAVGSLMPAVSVASA